MPKGVYKHNKKICLKNLKNGTKGKQRNVIQNYIKKLKNVNYDKSRSN